MKFHILNQLLGACWDPDSRIKLSDRIKDLELMIFFYFSLQLLFSFFCLELEGMNLIKIIISDKVDLNLLRIVGFIPQQAVDFFFKLFYFIPLSLNSSILGVQLLIFFFKLADYLFELFLRFLLFSLLIFFWIV